MTLNQNVELGEGGAGFHGRGPGTAQYMIREMQLARDRVLAGAGADTDIALPGALVGDSIISVTEFAAGIPTDRTDQCSITDVETMQCTVDTTGDWLVVHWTPKPERTESGIAGADVDTDIAVAGILLGDELVDVFSFGPGPGGGGIIHYTAEASITSSGNIQLTDTDTTGLLLTVHHEPAEKYTETIEEFIRGNAAGVFSPLSIIGDYPVTAWENEGFGGDPYDLDTVQGTAANLVRLESGVAVLPDGVAGDYISSSDAVQITDDITVEFWGSMVDWTPLSETALANKYETVDDKRAWQLNVVNGGFPKLELSSDGFGAGTLDDAISDTALPFTDGEFGGVRAKYDNSADEVTFETSTNGVDWTPHGTNPVALVVTGIDSNDADIEIGSERGGLNNRLIGSVRRVRVYDDATATNCVIDTDPSDAAQGCLISGDSWLSKTGETWTINGVNPFINNTGYPAIYGKGGVGIRTAAANTISSPVTAYAVFKPQALNGPPASAVVFDGFSNTARMLLETDNGSADRYTMFQGSGLVDIAEAYDANLRVIICEFKGDGTSKITVLGVGSITGDAGSHDWDFGRVFMDTTGGAQSIGLIFELHAFPGSHSTERITEIGSYLLDKYGA